MSKSKKEEWSNPRPKGESSQKDIAPCSGQWGNYSDGDRKINEVTNSFAPPTFPDQGGDSGDKKTNR
ncbi:MAG: hypothetical protein RSE33_12240 [Hafnia sp.]